jgi:hypothetical protein
MMPTVANEDIPPGVGTVAEEGVASKDLPMVTWVAKKDLLLVTGVVEVSMLVVRSCIIRQSTTESRRVSL